MNVRLANTPTLETERLFLRAPRMEDYPVWEAFYASDRARYIGGPGDTRAAWRALARIIGSWVLRGYGTFVVTLKGSDEAIGLVGPWHPIDLPEKEISWDIWTPEFEGKSLAFEAAVSTHPYASDKLGWTTAVSYIDKGNIRSIALAERLGATLDEPAERPDPEDLVYRHPTSSRPA